MNTKSIIEIFRGDDSDALGYQTIVGTIHTDLDLAGCKAVFRYLGFFQEFDPIPEDGKLTIVIPSASSIQFPPGLGYASLKVYDIDRKVRTFTNRIPVFVSTKTPCRCGGEFDVEFSPFPELEPLKIFVGPNADDFDQYTGFVSKIIDRASLVKYGLAILADAMSEDGGDSGKAASPLAVKAAYDAIIKELTDNYYTSEETEEAIDRVAAYYITYTAAGAAFPTYASLANATTVYSGGKVRVPTRNDYCVVLADETHDNSEYRYIYAVAEGETTGSWQPQFPVEGVMTVDQIVTKNSQNPVSGGGVWSALWGALSALPTGFSSLYDWVVSKLSEYRHKLDLNVYGYGNPTVSFADGFSVSYGEGGTEQKYTAPSGGEIITFIGPVPSSSEFAPNYKFYYPSTLGTLDSFDPNNYSVWCLVCDDGGTIPSFMMYRTGPYYYIGSFNSVTPTLSLSIGEATGDAPTMARPVGATGDTLALASQLAGKVPTSRTVNGKALSSDVTLTGADIPVDTTQGAPDVYTALNGKAGTSDLLAKLDSTSAAPAFNPAQLYSFGDLVTKDGILYQCEDVSVPPGSGWDLGSWGVRAVFDIAAQKAANPTDGNLAALDSQGNPIDSQIPAANVAVKADLRYSLVTKTISNNAVTLDDRAINAVAVSSSLASLTVNFPTATSGKARDFGLRLTVASGITTAPELALPQGVVCENADGEAPEIGADGAATILYFTETASGVFLVKGEVVTAIS